MDGMTEDKPAIIVDTIEGVTVPEFYSKPIWPLYDSEGCYIEREPYVQVQQLP